MADVRLDRLVVEVLFKQNSGAVGEMEKGFDALSKSAAKLGLALVGVGGSLVGGLAMANKAAADYEHAMSRISGLAGASADEMEVFDAGIRKIAREHGKGLTMLAEGLYPIRSAGHEGAAALDILERSMMASVAGMGEVAMMGRVATRALDQFAGLTPAKVFDTLTFGVMRGNFDPEELVAGMGRMLQIAPAFGVTFHEVTALLAGMSKAVDPTRAARQLEAILRFGFRPTSAALRMFEGETPEKWRGDPEVEALTKRIAASGWTYDALIQNIEEEGLLPTLKTMDDLFASSNKVWGVMIEDSSALLGIMTLLGKTFEGTLALVNEENDTTGLLEERAYAHAAATEKDRRADVMDRLEAAREAVGAHLADPLRWLYDVANAALNAFVDLPAAIHKLIAVVLLAGIPILGFGVLLLGLAPVIKSVGWAFKTWAAIMAKAQIAALIGKIGAVIGAIKAAVLSGPFLAIAAVIAALVAGVYALYHGWDSFRALLDRTLPDWMIGLLGGKKPAQQSYQLQLTEDRTRLRDKVEGLRAVIDAGILKEDDRIRAEHALTEATVRLERAISRQGQEDRRKEYLAAQAERHEANFAQLLQAAEGAVRARMPGVAQEAFQAALDSLRIASLWRTDSAVWTERAQARYDEVIAATAVQPERFAQLGEEMVTHWKAGVGVAGFAARDETDPLRMAAFFGEAGEHARHIANVLSGEGTVAQTIWDFSPRTARDATGALNIEQRIVIEPHVIDEWVRDTTTKVDGVIVEMESQGDRIAAEYEANIDPTLPVTPP